MSSGVYKSIEFSGVKYYGQHTILDCKGCTSNIRSIEDMKLFLASLSEIIGMVRFGDAEVYRFGEGIEEGLSGIQLIETSLISFHTNDKFKDLYLDVFSCKAYDINTLQKYVELVFAPKDIKRTVLLRE